MGKLHCELLIASGLAVSVGQVVIFAKIEVIPLGNADAVTHMTITMLSTGVTVLVLKEKVTFAKWLCIALLLLGTCLIIVGLWDSVDHLNVAYNRNETGNMIDTHALLVNGAQREIATKSISMLLFGFALCLIHGVCDFLEVYFAATLKEHVENSDPIIINFWNVTISLLVSLTMMLVFEHNKLALPAKQDDIIYFLIHILTAGGAQVFYVYLVRFLSVMVFSLVIYSEIPMKTISQYMIVPGLQPVKGGLYDLTGCLVITVGLVVPFLPKSKCTEDDHKEIEKGTECEPLHP